MFRAASVIVVFGLLAAGAAGAQTGSEELRRRNLENDVARETQALAEAERRGDDLRSITSQALTTGGLHVDASGNVGVGTDTPTAYFEMAGGNGSESLKVSQIGANDSVEVMFNLVCNCSPGFRMQNTTNGEVWFFRHTAAGDFSIDNVAGTGLEFRVSTGGNLFLKGTLSQGSSRTLKEDLTPLEGGQLLDVLAGLPLYEWSYKGEQARHLGPTAEDFAAAFGLGANDVTLAPADMAGVALAAVKDLREENQSLRDEVGALSEKLAAIEELLRASQRD